MPDSSFSIKVIGISTTSPSSSVIASSPTVISYCCLVSVFGNSAANAVSDLSKADEAAKGKRTLAAQEQEKAQAARRNEGAGSRAEEAKQVFLEVAKRIPADQRQTVLERMEQYNSHEAGGMEVFKAEIEARRVLDSALKEQTQDREHEKTKVKGRGRTD